MKSKFDNFTDEELKEIIINAKSFKEIAQKAGYSGCNGNTIKKIRIIADKLEITTPLLERQRKKSVQEYLGEINGFLEVVKVEGEKLYCKCHNCNKEELHPVLASNFYKTKSCGCLKTERFIEGRYEDLSGQIFQHLKAIDINKEKSSEFGKTYWNCLCLRCNKNIVPVQAWELKNNRKDNCGCYNRKSKGEEKINQVLTSMNINFKQEYTFENFYAYKGHCYRFDFAIFEDNKLKCLIEYHGKQHYDKTHSSWEDVKTLQERDKTKEEYCKNNNIPLYIIPYTEYNNIEKILKELL